MTTNGASARLNHFHQHQHQHQHGRIATVAPQTTHQSIELADLSSVATPSARHCRFALDRFDCAEFVHSDSDPDSFGFGLAHGHDPRRPRNSSRHTRQRPNVRTPDKHAENRRKRVSARAKSWAEALQQRSRKSLAKQGGEGQKPDEPDKMKFSHSLQFNAVPDWSSYYIAYSNLKKLCVLPS